MSLTLRHEAPADHRAVETLVREAFWNVYKPGCDEHYYLHLLRQSPAFRPELTFVCEVGRRPGRADRLHLQLHRAGGWRAAGHRHLRPPGRPPLFSGKRTGPRPGVPCPAAGSGPGGTGCGDSGRSPALRPLRLLVWRALGHCPGERPVSAWPPGAGTGTRLPGKRRRALPRGLCLCPPMWPRWTLLTPSSL